VAPGTSSKKDAQQTLFTHRTRIDCPYCIQLQALALHPNFIAVGLSLGGVLVAPGKPGKEGAHQSQSKAFVLGGGGQVACTALDMYLTGELLLAGYLDGSLVLWDVQRAAPARWDPEAWRLS
jgi:predicted alpha/beta-fold hydrolase